jgi:hypothetical protein
MSWMRGVTHESCLERPGSFRKELLRVSGKKEEQCRTNKTLGPFFPMLKGKRPFFTPNELHIKAQGCFGTKLPWENDYPPRVLLRRSSIKPDASSSIELLRSNPLLGVFYPRVRSLGSRPWAMGCNSFGVKKDESPKTKPLLFFSFRSKAKIVHGVALGAV